MSPLSKRSKAAPTRSKFWPIPWCFKNSQTFSTYISMHFPTLLTRHQCYGEARDAQFRAFGFAMLPLETYTSDEEITKLKQSIHSSRSKLEGSIGSKRLALLEKWFDDADHVQFE